MYEYIVRIVGRIQKVIVLIILLNISIMQVCNFYIKTYLEKGPCWGVSPKGASGVKRLKNAGHVVQEHWMTVHKQKHLL